MGFVIGWLLIGGVTAAVGSSNEGSGGFGWFIIGVLLGPIGLIFALFASSPEKKSIKKADNKGYSSDHRKCPQCAEIVKRDAKVCKHCGHEFEHTVEELKEKRRKANIERKRQRAKQPMFKESDKKLFITLAVAVGVLIVVFWLVGL